MSPYIGVAYGTFEDRARVIGGLNITFNERWSSTILFDGVRVHPLLNYTRGRHQFGVIFERGRIRARVTAFRFDLRLKGKQLTRASNGRCIRLGACVDSPDGNPRRYTTSRRARCSS